MKDQTDLESSILDWMEEIKHVPPRSPQSAARGRAQFLGQAVSANEFRRHKGWSSIFRKERFAMNLMISILVIAGLLFGGGATVGAAQDDLPNEPLYAVKMWSEDLSLQFRNEPEQKVDRLMELAQVRVQEMEGLTRAGQAVPDQVRQRLEQHIHQALQLCSSMEDADLDQALLQIRDHLQQQDREMERLQLHAPQTAQPVLTQTRTMIKERLHLVEKGLLDHEMFRSAVRKGFRFGQDGATTPSGQSGPGPQNGQSTAAPAGPDPDPGGPNTDPGGPNSDPGGPNTESAVPGSEATPSPTGGGNGPGGSGSGGGGKAGNDPGGSGGDGSGGGGSSGGSGPGEGGSGGNKP